MDVFKIRSTVVLINGDYYVFPWNDGEIAIVDTMRMYTAHDVTCTYVTPYMVSDINPSTINNMQLLNVCLKKRVNPSWCRGIIYPYHHIRYTRFNDALPTCEPFMLLIRQYLDNEMY